VLDERVFTQIAGAQRMIDGLWTVARWRYFEELISSLPRLDEPTVKDLPGQDAPSMSGDLVYGSE
jgi:hypothetical protein